MMSELEKGAAGMEKKVRLEDKLSRIVSLKPSQSAVEFVINTIKDLLIEATCSPANESPPRTN